MTRSLVADGRDGCRLRTVTDYIGWDSRQGVRLQIGWLDEWMLSAEESVGGGISRYKLPGPETPTMLRMSLSFSVVSLSHYLSIYQLTPSDQVQVVLQLWLGLADLV